MADKPKLTVLQKIEARRTILPNGCWESDFTPNTKHPILRDPINKKNIYVHRFMYEQTYGKISPKELLFHKCNNTRCHNPKHLFIRTSENLLTALQKIEARRIILPTGCWESDFTPNHNYPAVRNKDGQRYYVHRYMYEQVHGKIPTGMQVLHTCDNPKCHNPAHLFIGKPIENTQDMLKKGRNRPAGIKRKDLVVVKAILLSNIDKTNSEIAKAIGCHLRSVTYYLRKLGLSKPSKTVKLQDKP